MGNRAAENRGGGGDFIHMDRIEVARKRRVHVYQFLRDAYFASG